MVRLAVLLSAALAAAIVLCAAPAAAEDDRITREARALYVDGTRLYKIGRYQEAALRFQDGYLKKSDASFLFNLGQCYRQMHEPEQAAREYRAYLRDKPDAPNREDVETFIREADAELRRQSTTATPAHAVAPPAERTAPPPTSGPPVYKQWWLWTAVGGALAVGVGVGLGVGLSQSSDHLFPTIVF